MRRALGGLAGVGLLLAGIQAQTPAPPTQPPTRTGSGLLLGRVLDGLTTRPVAGAMVTLSGPGVPPQKVIVDAEGRFLFTKLPDGPFMLAAAKTGFIGGVSGQRIPNGPGRPIELAPGARIGDAVVRLWKYAAISGAVLDDAGDPAAGVEVRLVERQIVDGEKVLAQGAAGSVTTDDRGVYRFSTVVPGEYLVFARSATDVAERMLLSLAMTDQSAMASIAARASAGRIEDILELDASVRVYPPVFYPAAAAPAEAQPVRIRAGDERSGIDLRVRAVPVGRVSGTLLHAGEPLAAARVRLTIPDSATGSEIEVASAASGRDGRFGIMGVPAGTYTLRASRGARTSMGPGAARGRGAAQPALPLEPTLWAAQTIVAGSPEAASLSIAMQPGVTIRGRFEFAGSSARPTPEEIVQIRVTVIPADRRGIDAVPLARIEPDGTFITSGLVPGRYRLQVAGRGSWRAASAIAGNVDVLDAFQLDSDLDDIVIRMLDQPPASIDGTIRTSQGTPDPDAVVVILPADPRLIGTRRLRELRTTGAGAYRASGLPAGDYVVALTSDERLAAGLDREEMMRLIQIGIRVTLADGERRTIDLRSEGRR